MIPYAEQLKERQAGFGRNLQTVASTPGEEVVVVEEGKTPFAGSFKHNSVAASDGNVREDILNHMHKFRLQSFEQRINDPMNVKPYLPMLSSDEKEVIMEQYYASKKKLMKV